MYVTKDFYCSSSRSPNLQIDANSEHSGSRSRSNSRSGSPSHSSRSVSRSPAKSVHSGSRSRSRSKSHSRSRSASQSRSRSRSGSHSVRSRSQSRSRSRSRSGSRSRSRSGSRGSIRSQHSNAKSKQGSPEAEANASQKRRIGSDDENDEPATKRKTGGLVDTDTESEDDIVKEPGVTADTLFGDADDISTDEEEKRDARAKQLERDDSRDDRRSDSRSDRRSSMSSDGSDREKRDEDDIEKEPEPEPLPETRINVEIPRIVTDLGKEIHFVKLPNFLSVDTRPFDQETYEDEIDEEETLDEEGRQRIKLKVSNTIRWRDYMDDSGNMVRESNSRVVKWSDGSMSLHLGNEIFDVYKHPLQGDHNHLFIRQGTGLQGQAVFRTRLSFRPHSTESFTHKKMTMSLADRSQKTAGIKILTQVGHDPDADRMYNLKKEEEKLRQAMRQKHQAKPRRSGGATHHNAYREDEGSEDENGISLAAIKNKYKKGSAGSSGAKGIGM